MPYSKDLTGERFGNLTVLQRTEEKEEGYYQWLCQCDCGRKIKVNTRKLKRGTITNCGCTSKNNAKHGHTAQDITGQRFGKLIAVKRVANKGGRTAWECQCDCGNTHVVTTKELKAGKCQSCGCLKREKYRGMLDITGKKIGRLTVEFPTEKRDRKGSIYWHCKCECGNEVDISADNLVHGNYCSCGCFRREVVWNQIQQQRHLIDGTCLEILEKRKHRCDNKSGFRGVFQMKNGKYKVEIGFKRKRYYINTARTLEEAIQDRLEVEKMVHDGFVQAYYKWKEETDEKEEVKTPLIYDVEKINGKFIVNTNIEV